MPGVRHSAACHYGSMFDAGRPPGFVRGRSFLADKLRTPYDTSQVRPLLSTPALATQYLCRSLYEIGQGVAKDLGKTSYWYGEAANSKAAKMQTPQAKPG